MKNLKKDEAHVHTLNCIYYKYTSCTPWFPCGPGGIRVNLRKKGTKMLYSP